jgi:uncharacterized protein YjbI with pentapeptide repeats
MTEQQFKKQLESEISFKEVLNFLLDSWKVIVGLGVLGFLGGLGYLTITPNQYEATAQIQMAQISNNNNSPAVNVEDPILLIARLQQPTTYSAIEVKACGLEGERMPNEILAGMPKFSSVNGVGSILVLKIRTSSKELSLTCAQALFENIRLSQNRILKPHIDNAKALLEKYKDRLIEAQSLVSRADKSGIVLSAAYLSSRDEIKFLTDESIRLNSFIAASDVGQTRLVSPIYANENPIFPKRKMALTVGLFLGIFLGIIIMISRRAIALSKSISR